MLACISVGLKCSSNHLKPKKVPGKTCNEIKQKQTDNEVAPLQGYEETAKEKVVPFSWIPYDLEKGAMFWFIRSS